jgi:hypothetical protein
MVEHVVHGTNANAKTLVSADFDTFDHTNGMSCVVTGNKTIVLYNPPAGSAITATVPSANDPSNNRKNDALINATSIPSPGFLILPKFKAQGWSQGAEGIHIDTSAAGLLYAVLVDPTD